MKFSREATLPYPQPWEWINENIEFMDENLFFVDVGAHDGILSSNTGYFEIDLGWNGICIEPNPSVFETLKKNRNSILYNCVVSETEGEVDFLILTGYTEMLSGIYSEYDEKHIRRIESELAQYGGTKEIVKIPSKSLNTILKENNVEKVDYLSVDVEGGEMTVLKSVDFDNFDIRIISVENNGYNNKVKDFLLENGYQFLTTCCWDDIYYKE